MVLHNIHRHARRTAGIHQRALKTLQSAYAENEGPPPGSPSRRASCSEFYIENYFPGTQAPSVPT